MEYSDVEILFVEDNLDDARLTMRALKKKNLANNILHLKNGEEAIDYLFAKGIYADRNKTDHPKLILLDLKMPKINGLEVLEAIKADPLTQTIPVVVLTSSQEDPDIRRCYALGVNSYIVKPVNFENFFDAVTKLGVYWLMVNKGPA
ncbi:MAG TPA: response regulator [Bacteroidia bacterium]|nr:response regulator [Bacteroidia bacterium]